MKTKKVYAKALILWGGRTNLLEELGRVEGERYNPNRKLKYLESIQN